MLAGRPTDFNGTRLDASLETFLTKKRKNKGRRGGVLAGRPTDFNGTGLDSSLEGRQRRCQALKPSR